MLLPTGAMATTLTEDFESYETFGVGSDTEPGLSWYTYRDTAEVGSFEQTSPVEGLTSWAMVNNGTEQNTVTFTLNGPAQISTISFQVRGTTPSENGNGSYTYIAIESSSPIRRMVEFYFDCRDNSAPNACEMKVRSEIVDTTGEVLINTTLNEKVFNITMTVDWINSEFDLQTNGVDDGTFPFLELPSDFGRVRFTQTRSDVPMGLTFDNWTVEGAEDVAATVVSGDVATGIQNFAADIKFTSSTSLFLLGVVIFSALVAAVLVPARAFGGTAYLAPAISLYASAAVLWIVRLEFWPNWIVLSMIIVSAAIVGLFTRKALLGIQDASTGAGIVAGALGYFIISTSLLAMSGFATETVSTPSQPVTNSTAVEQSFTVGVIECVFSLFSDCSTKTETKFFSAISDIVTWARASADFMFDLLTLQLPIPVVFNAMIVLPPASALAYQGFALVRGSA